MKLKTEKSEDIKINENIKLIHMKYVNITSIIYIIIWIIFCILLFKYFISKGVMNNYFYFILCLIPLFTILYHKTIIHKIISSSKLYNIEKKNIINKIKTENDFAKTVPVIIFGLGLVLGAPFDVKMKLSAFPFLIFALIFGSIIPFFLSLINFKESDIKKLIVSETLQFSLESCSVSFLIMAVYIPLYLSINHYVIN